MWLRCALCYSAIPINAVIGDSFTCNELRKRLGIDDIITVVQRNRWRWYGRASRQNENEAVKKCMDYEVEGVRPTGRPKKLKSKVVEKRLSDPATMQVRCCEV